MKKALLHFLPLYGLILISCLQPVQSSNPVLDEEEKQPFIVQPSPVSPALRQTGNVDTNGGISENVISNGSLSFNRSNTPTFGGDISSSSVVNNRGSSTLILTSTAIYKSSYAYGTHITVMHGSMSRSLSGRGSMISIGKLIFSRSDNITYGGSLDTSSIAESTPSKDGNE